MTWAFLDDHANEDEKLQEVGGATAWYWACGLMYCRRKERERRTKGRQYNFIPKAAALGLYPDPKAAQHVKKLVEIGLWEEVEGGYIVPGYRKVYGSDGTEVPPPLDDEEPPSQPPAPPIQPARPSAAQLGGQARARQASRGPAGRFQPAASSNQPVGPAAVQPAGNQPRVRVPGPAPDPDTRSEFRPAAADPKDLTGHGDEAPDSEAASAAGRVDVDVPTEPRNKAEALEMPICARAKFVQDRPDMAPWLLPQEWPEVQRIGKVFEEATGHPRPLGPYHADGGVRAVVALFAVGLMPSDIERGVRLVVASGWWKAATRGLQSLSIEVITRELSKASTAATSSSASKYATMVTD